MAVGRWAMIDETSCIVQNVSLWDGNPETWQPEPGILMIAISDDSPVGINDIYDVATGTFTRPES